MLQQQIGRSSTRALSSAAPAVDESDSRLGALRKKLRDEEESAAMDVTLHDFSFSGDVSYGTAVPRRNRDKTGKVCVRASNIRVLVRQQHPATHAAVYLVPKERRRSPQPAECSAIVVTKSGKCRGTAAALYHHQRNRSPRSVRNYAASSVMRAHEQVKVRRFVWVEP